MKTRLYSKLNTLGILRLDVRNRPKMGTIPFPQPKWQSEISVIAKLAFARSLLLSQMQAAMLLSTTAIDGHNPTAKINLPNYLFSPEKVVSAIGKCRIILVTIYVTTDAVYRQQCNATKAYRPVGKETEDVQRRLNSSMLTETLHIHQHQQISSMTAAQAHSKYTRRRRIFHRDNFVTQMSNARRI